MEVVKDEKKDATKAAKAPEAKKETKEIVDLKEIGISEIPIPEEVDYRIVVDKLKNNQVKTLILTRTQQEVDFFAAVGVLQSSISNALAQPAQTEDPADHEVILDEIDVEMDITGQLKQMKLKLGDSLKVTKKYFELREISRKNFIENKEKK
tara:strand:- start:107960 stop:108415 length:456 start_codon:yes stop_codon:yes gene_type:complete